MLLIRRAKAADLDALVRLCRASVGPHDYVPEFLKAFLRTGVVLVAEDSGRAVGMMVYHDVPDGSAWLHAARTHPSFRRKGVATALMARCEALARRRRRTSMRLWANADNLPSVNANTKYGFRERARFTRMRANAIGSAAHPRLVPLNPDGEWSLVADSRALRAGGGFLFHDFYFVPMTRSNARWLSSRGALWRFGRNVLAVSEDFEAGGASLQVQILAGNAAAILRTARELAGSQGAARVESFLPHDAVLLRTARLAGFRLMGWGQEAVLFEKGLRVRGRRSSTIGCARAGRTRS